MIPYALAFTSNVNNGETQTGIIISSGDIQNINYGGTANDTTINRGSQFIYSGGTANNTTVNFLG